MGLGVLGGGLATTRWFLERGAKVTVTDLRTRAKLAASIKALGKDAGRIRFVLGRHNPGDFRTHDLIVVNPAVPRTSLFLRVARRAGKRIVNDASIFFDEVRNPVIAVTGTRGKTTTANWIGHFLGARAGGNSSSDLPLLKLLDSLKPGEPSVVELSSWQLELLPQSKRGPAVAVITNVYPDHLNRYRGMREYAAAKANIFSRQTKKDHLILNMDSAWTRFFLKKRPKARTWFFSLMPLPKGKNGMFLDRRRVYFRENGRARVILPSKLVAQCEAWGDHNFSNLLAALLAARLADAPWRTLLRRIPTLPQIKYREEIVLQRRNLTIVNDSAGTSPDATIAALRRFSASPEGAGQVLLLAGGTDKDLEFREWARVVARHVQPRNLFLLEGNATLKMIRELRRIGYFRAGMPQAFGTLRAMIHAVRSRLKRERYALKTVVLFSPGAASFEKFKNEFDRGEKFNLYCRRIIH